MFDFLWITDPSAWLGLLTLTVLEIVLGIDNLVFIAILASKLPARLQDKARYTGLGGALIIRLVLLSLISWIVTLTDPILLDKYSVRDIILVVGGVFLLYKATHELHEKLEGSEVDLSKSKAQSQAFGLVVSQIIILDAVFSLDSVITAVGMCKHLSIMALAVIIAMVIMISLSKFLTNFVTQRPTLVILCLGFLLMIGFSLLAEGFHVEVPKSYLYSAIGFSILIEILNQIARKNTLKLDKNIKNSRELAASLVLRILGSKSENHIQTLKESLVTPTEAVFEQEEKNIVSRALQLNYQPIRACMTARPDVYMVNISDSKDEILHNIVECDHSHIVVYKNDNKDAPIGFINKSDVLKNVINNKNDIDFEKLIVQPLYVPETISVLTAIEEMKQLKNYFMFVVDEFGNFEGLATLRDIMEDIAGEMPEQSEELICVKNADGSFEVKGDISLAELQRQTQFIVEQSVHYSTLAGFILEKEQSLPVVGSKSIVDGWEIEILSVVNHTIETVKLKQVKKSVSEK